MVMVVIVFIIVIIIIIIIIIKANVTSPVAIVTLIKRSVTPAVL